MPHVVKDQEFARKLAALYAEYQHQLVANNRLDFSSLLLLTHRLLTERPAIAEQLRTVYPSVCVDEFQDTNLAQYKVLKAVVGDAPKDLFVVADDDQIIYQWNGASPERLQALRTDFKMQVLQLPANYRCPAEVIVLANRLIRHNLDRAADKQPLYAIKQAAKKTVVHLQHFDTFDTELEWIAADIRASHLPETGSCAILARTRKVLEAAVTKLQTGGITASLTVRKAEFTSAPFRFMHAIFCALRIPEQTETNSVASVKRFTRSKESTYMWLMWLPVLLSLAATISGHGLSPSEHVMQSTHRHERSLTTGSAFWSSAWIFWR